MERDLDKALREKIITMPSLPTSVIKVLEICNNPQTSPADLNYVISLDPVLVGRVLKLINSAYYGLEQPVTSLVRAIIMLGINTVKNLALSTTIMGQISSDKSSRGLDMEGFWRHSLCVGVSAKLLARKRGIDIKATEDYFTAGLLHDIGKIPLNAVLSEEYMRTISTADRERKPLFQVEETLLGRDHCAAGALISTAWKLDGPVGDAIVHHHDSGNYSGNYRDVLCTVAAANYFASLSGIGFSGDRHPDLLPSGIWDILAIDRDILFGIEETVKDEIEKATIFLKIDHL